MTVDEFINRYNGVHIDEDGYYGAQCWDVSARYAREVVGCPSFPTGSGGAEGVYRLFQSPIPNYFTRIANNKSDPNQLPKKGDVIVWDKYFSAPWGHTGVCISADSSGVTCLEQNGNNPGGVAYIKKRGWSNISGWLRPKTQPSSGGSIVMNQESGTELYRTALHREPESASAASQWNGQTPAQALRSVRGSEWNVTDSKVKNYDGVVKQRDTANAQVTQLNNKVSDLGKTIADLSKRPTQADLDAEVNKNTELVKVNEINQGEIERLKQENEDLTARVGDQKFDVGQAIRLLVQTIKDAISGK